MVGVRKDLEICLGRGAPMIPLRTELRKRAGWKYTGRMAALHSGNPNGIVSSSPRLRGTSYLGLRFKNKFNRNAVVAIPFSFGVRVMLAATALRLGIFCGR